MPLAALILCEDEGEEGQLPATFPVTGQSLLEFDVRHLRALGAGHIVVLADRLPAPMMQSIEKLTVAGIKIEIVRDARTAAEAIHPEEDLLVLSGNILATPAQLAALAARETRCLVTVPDSQEAHGFERIDAQTYWTGLSRLDGAILRETAALLGDWQLSSTLLRVAVQNGVEQIRPVTPDAVIRLTNLEDASHANAVVARGLAHVENADWLEQFIFRPAIGKLTNSVFNRSISPGWVSAGALALMAGAIGWAAIGYLGFGLLALMLAILPLRIAHIINAAGAIEGRFSNSLLTILTVSCCIMLAAYGANSLLHGNMLDGILALWTSSSYLLVQKLARPPKWAAGVVSVSVSILPFALAGYAHIGLTLAIAYCLATQWADVRARSSEKSQV